LLRTGTLRRPASVPSITYASSRRCGEIERSGWTRCSDGAQRDCLDALEALRRALNRELQLGLFEFEGHFAAYPPDAFYRRHRDSQEGAGARVVSCVLYLNHAWRPEDGGQLRLYLEASDSENCRDVLPEGGTLVCFLSQRFWHEVLPATRVRHSLTGWFRQRAVV
jgi:SM-20-related protein